MINLTYTEQMIVDYLHSKGYEPLTPIELATIMSQQKGAHIDTLNIMQNLTWDTLNGQPPRLEAIFAKIRENGKGEGIL